MSLQSASNPARPGSASVSADGALIKSPWITAGLHRKAWYRIPAAHRPQPVAVPGLGKRWRVADILAWVADLPTLSTRRRRKASKPAEAAEPAQAPEPTPQQVA